MRFLTIVAITFFISAASFSQSFYSLNYTMSYGLGETGDYIKQSSFRGMTFEGRGFVSDNITLGGLITWSTFYEKLPNETFDNQGVVVTGTQYRYLNAFPMLFQAHYFLGNSVDETMTYIGLGTGAYKMIQRVNTGIWTLEYNNWHFGVSPEVGVFIPVSYSSGLNLSLRYHYVFKASETIDHSWLGLNVGFFWNN